MELLPWLMGAQLAVEGKNDPIHQSHYKPLEWAEKVNDLLFYVSTALCTLTALLAKLHKESLASGVGVLLVIVVLIAFILGLVIRTYFTPRAEDCRRTDMASAAFGARLQPMHTENYYNNQEDPSFRRLASIVAENAFFSKSIAQEMCIGERTKAGLSVILFLILALYRDIRIDWVVVAAQAVASEQILSKWWRLEWLRGKFERTYDESFILLNLGRQEGSVFKAKALALAMNYEAAKANAGILLSQKVFNKMNARLTQAWEAIHMPNSNLH